MQDAVSSQYNGVVADGEVNGTRDLQEHIHIRMAPNTRFEFPVDESVKAFAYGSIEGGDIVAELITGDADLDSKGGKASRQALGEVEA